MFVGWIPDAFGRKKTVLYSMGASLLIQVIFVLCQNHEFRYICYFCLAMCNVKNGCSYVWAFELAGAKNKMFVTTVMNVIDRGTLVVYALFMLFVSRWYFVLVSFYWVLGMLAWIVIYFVLPESPLWHVMNNRNEQAIDNLN